METLYNGIVLADDWLKNATPPSGIEADIPYLQAPPAVIDISVGRQLFVDSFLIAETDLQPTYHRAKKHPKNPVLKPETVWETEETLPLACPKGGGVWYDEAYGCYRMWYEAGWLNELAYAESSDGIHWKRPVLDPVTGSNLLFSSEQVIPVRNTDGTMTQISGKDLQPDSTSVWIDSTADPKERYKLFFRPPTRKGLYDPAIVATSSDGIHWENFRYTPTIGDRSTAFYNPFRKKWVYSIRDYWKSRSRRYRECDDFLDGAAWIEEEAVHWLAADSKDTDNPFTSSPISLYNTDVIAYESILVGMFEAWYGPDNTECLKTGCPKHTALMPMYSRDGFHFSRPNRTPLIQEDPDSWDKGYIQSVTGGLIVHEDTLWLYYTGVSGDSSRITDSEYTNGMYAGGATGIAILRRDGFVSMGSSQGGYLMTRLLTAKDTHYLFVNLDGAMTVDVLMDDGTTFTSLPVECDSTRQQVLFEDFDLAVLAGTIFRLRFRLKKGQLYAFWFSDSNYGNSDGYLAAGKPRLEEGCLKRALVSD